MARQKEYNRRRAAEEHRRRALAYYRAHAAEINAKRRGNPRIKDQHRAYYLRNREEILARQKEYNRRRAAEKRAARERAEPREDHCRIAGAIPKGNQKNER